MRVVTVHLCVLMLVTAAWGEEQAKTPKQVAAAYFEALTKGDIAAADTLATAPFSLDRKKVLATHAEVKAIHQKILANKGQRAVPKYTIDVTTAAPPLDPKQFPAYLAFRVTITMESGKAEHVDIYVSKMAPPKILGFSD